MPAQVRGISESGSGYSICHGRVSAIAKDMLTLLVILLILAVLGGGFGYSRYGWGGMSPAGLIVLILVIMAVTGNL